MMNAQEILSRCMSYLHMDITRFARAIGADVEEMQKLAYKGDLLPDHVIEAINGRYPELSKTWLMFGEGEMFSDVGINRLPTERRGNYEIIDVYGNRMKAYEKRLEKREGEKMKAERAAKREESACEKRISELEETIRQKDKVIAELTQILENLGK